jgi:hypothetical protein
VLIIATEPAGGDGGGDDGVAKETQKLPLSSFLLISFDFMPFLFCLPSCTL